MSSYAELHHHFKPLIECELIPYGFHLDMALIYILLLDSIFTVIELRSHANLFRFHLESFWNLSGISMEFPWNSIQIPLGIHRNHSGISMEFPWNSTEIPLGIHGNPQEWYIPTIPADSQWNSDILQESSGIWRNSWRRVKYCSHAQPSLITHTQCMVCGILTSNVVIGNSRNRWWDDIVITKGDFFIGLKAGMNATLIPISSHTSPHLMVRKTIEVSPHQYLEPHCIMILT